MIPEEHWAKALKLRYAEKFDWSRLVYDITYTSIGAAVVEDFYDENAVFLLSLINIFWPYDDRIQYPMWDL